MTKLRLAAALLIGETLRAFSERCIAAFETARPPGGIDLVRLYEENLIDGVVF